MKTYAPDYYNHFKCIAKNCKHNCCIGWEIDIDAETYKTYKSTKGDIGKKLKQNIVNSNEDGIYFKLDENERCPFLLDNNLCEIIINLGKDYLCQICTDHPRFRNYLESRTEIGLGLCCEAACELILNNKNKTKIIEIYDDGIDDESSEESDFLNTRNHYFEIVQDRSVNFDKRIQNLCKEAKIHIPELDLKKTVKQLLSLEQLDKQWTMFLNNITELPANSNNVSDILCEQLLTYFIYRHMTIDNNLSGLKFAVICLKIILILAPYHNDFYELCRMFSSEIEYSNENTDYFMN